jgi:hypothetical protein
VKKEKKEKIEKILSDLNEMKEAALKMDMTFQKVEEIRKRPKP